MKTLSYLFVFLTVLLSSCVDVQEKISKYDVNKEINVDEDYAPVLDEIKSTYAKECIIGMLNDQNKSSYITFGIFTSYTIDFNYGKGNIHVNGASEETYNKSLEALNQVIQNDFNPIYLKDILVPNHVETNMTQEQQYLAADIEDFCKRMKAGYEYFKGSTDFAIFEAKPYIKNSNTKTFVADIVNNNYQLERQLSFKIHFDENGEIDNFYYEYITE